MPNILQSLQLVSDYGAKSSNGCFDSRNAYVDSILSTPTELTAGQAIEKLLKYVHYPITRYKHAAPNAHPDCFHHKRVQPWNWTVKNGKC